MDAYLFTKIGLTGNKKIIGSVKRPFCRLNDKNNGVK